MIPDEVVPHVQHILDLVLEYVARHPEIPLVFTGEEDRLLEQVQVFHPERRMGRVRRAVTIARHLVRPPFSHHSPPLHRGLPPLGNLTLTAPGSPGSGTRLTASSP